MPLGSTRKYYKRKRPTYRRKKGTNTNLIRAIKNVTLKQCETKRSSQYTEDLQQIFHNKTYYAQSLLATTQGTADPQGLNMAGRNRVGDEVIAKGLSIKFFLENVSSHPNIIYKIYVFQYNVLESPINDQYFWCGTDGFGANMNRTLDKPHTDRLKILKVMTINPRLGSMSTPSGGLVKTRQLSCWIPLKNRRIQYNADNSINPRFRDIGFAVLAYDAINTPEIEVISNFQYASTFYYKDP